MNLSCHSIQGKFKDMRVDHTHLTLILMCLDVNGNQINAFEWDSLLIASASRLENCMASPSHLFPYSC